MLRLLVPTALLLASCQNEEPVTSAPPPSYQTLHHPKFKGAFFQFEHDGDAYLACSIHQAHLKPGTEVFRDGEAEPVVLDERLHTQKDLQVWTYHGGSSELLKYHSDPAVEIDDRIVFLHRGQKIEARVARLPEGEDFRVTYQTDVPFAAAGLSGSPVYLPRTGSVIGVLQTANDREKATFGGLELLEFP